MSDRAERSEPSRILVVDDDHAYSHAIRDGLVKAGFSVEMADNGRSAASLVGFNAFDLVLSDIRMSECNGIQLLHAVKRMRKELPVVLMTGYCSESSEEEARNLGAAGYLAKPFSLTNLIELLRGLLDPAGQRDEPAEARADDEFCQISIDEFISGKTVDLDLYIRLSEGKFVKIAHAGQELSIGRLQSYRKRNLEFLFVSRADYEKYVSLQLRLAKAVSGSTSLDQARKVKFLRHANEVILQKLFMDGVDERSFVYAQNLTKANLAVLSQSDGLADLLPALNAHSDYVFAHSLGVSVYATMLSRRIGWGSPSTLYKMSLGGLLHDIGLKEVPRSILEKPRRAFSVEESKIYERHPLMGIDLLRGVREIPTEVMLMVSQHHENRTGSGYPAGLREAHIFPLARLLAIADEFCDLTIRAPGVNPMSAEEAIRYLDSVKRPFLDAKMLDSFKALFGFTKQGRAA